MALRDTIPLGEGKKHLRIVGVLKINKIIACDAFGPCFSLSQQRQIVTLLIVPVQNPSNVIDQEYS